MSADIQRDGIYFLIKGFNENEEGWYLDYGFLSGETAEKGKGAWKKLSEIAERGAPLPRHQFFPFDLIMVDTNYHTEAAKDFVNNHSTAMAVNGVAGWGRPFMIAAIQQELKVSGAKRKFGGVKVWSVGTYTIKNVLVARYARTVDYKPGSVTGLPYGVCHFPSNAEDYLFEQLTSEAAVNEVNKKTGQNRMVWKQLRKDNHLFDCDVYALAGLDHLGSRAGRRGFWTDDQWAARERLVKDTIENERQGDLLDPRRMGGASALQAMAKRNQ